MENERTGANRREERSGESRSVGKTRSETPVKKIMGMVAVVLLIGIFLLRRDGGVVGPKGGAYRESDAWPNSEKGQSQRNKKT